MNPNAKFDQQCSNVYGQESCGAGWKECKKECVDFTQRTRRRGDPGPLPPREEEYDN